MHTYTFFFLRVFRDFIAGKQVQYECMGLTLYYSISDPFETQQLLQDQVKYYLCEYLVTYFALDQTVDLLKPGHKHDIVDLDQEQTNKTAIEIVTMHKGRDK